LPFREMPMNLRKSVIFTLILFGLLFGCGSHRDRMAPSPSVTPPAPVEPEVEKVREPEKRNPQDWFVLLPEPDGKVGKIRVTAEGGSQIIDRPWFGVKVEESGKGLSTPQPLGENEIREIFGGALEVHPDLPNRFASFCLRFESDTAKLTPESRKTLKEVLKTVKSRRSTEIYVAGHTDRMGTEAHNFTLSSIRAFYVRDFLIANGVKASSLTVSYHGESAPLVYTEDEVPEPANRRVEVYIR